MDYFRRNQNSSTSKRRLVRGADGRLRPAAEDIGINDIWAEQKRIRLAESIAEDKRKAEKKQKRQNAKGVVVNISMPKIKLPRFRLINFIRINNKKFAVVFAVLLFVAAAGAGGYLIFGRQDGKQASDSDVLTAESLAAQEPEYQTVLPEGKTIDSLGGWARVSPPEKDPVFAYVDMAGGVQLNVSQQIVPANFKDDPSGELAKLAEQFSATKRLVSDDLTIYIGTSSKGPQSAMLIKNGLLILIRSESMLPDDEWLTYAKALH